MFQAAKQGAGDYLSDGWNWVDMAHSFLGFGSIWM